MADAFLRFFRLAARRFELSLRISLVSIKDIGGEDSA